MLEQNIYRFSIDVFDIETIPMGRLAQYMEQLALLFGEPERVHFHGLEAGSTVMLTKIEEPAIPKVIKRLEVITSGDGAPDGMKAYTEINRLLTNDNAIGALLAPDRDVIIRFPGRESPKRQSYGPFNEEGSLDGILTSLGGIDKTISLQLRNGDIKYVGCEATIELAKKLSHYFHEPIRIYGRGRWQREEDGNWKLVHFTVKDFEPLEKHSLEETANELRKVVGSEWKKLDNPLQTLKDLRDEESELH